MRVLGDQAMPPTSYFTGQCCCGECAADDQLWGLSQPGRPGKKMRESDFYTDKNLEEKEKTSLLRILLSPRKESGESPMRKESPPLSVEPQSKALGHTSPPPSSLRVHL